MSEYFTFNEYMKNNKLTPSEEDYVEMIYRINLNRGNVQVKDVANELNIKPASVTKMVKKLNDKDILEYKKYDYTCTCIFYMQACCSSGSYRFF